MTWCDGYSEREKRAALARLIRDMDGPCPECGHYHQPDEPCKEDVGDRDDRLYHEHVDRCLMRGEDWR